MKKLAIAILALVVAASAALAASQFKAGDISFSVMDKDGATPMQAASIQMLGSEDGALVAETSTDDLGQAMLALDEGRYVIRVNDLNLALFDVGSEGISVCRVIMPDAALLAGGQDQGGDVEGAGDEDEGAAWNASWFWPVVGGVVIAGVLVGAGFIIDNNTKHGHHHRHHDEILPVPPAKYKPSKPSPAPSAS